MKLRLGLIISWNLSSVLESNDFRLSGTKITYMEFSFSKIRNKDGGRVSFKDYKVQKSDHFGIKD